MACHGRSRFKVAAMKEQVYEFVKSIPRGKVATYGQIALHLGNRNFARVVGNILHNNPDPEHIPCHRVVNAQGRLSRSYALGGIAAQRHLKMVPFYETVYKSSLYDLIIPFPACESGAEREKRRAVVFASGKTGKSE